MARDDLDQTSVVDPLVGAVLDRRYRIELRLGAGGFGAIYRAVHVITERPVALKVLHARLANRPDVVARFRREAVALARLRSPHTVTAYDFGETPDGTLYIVLELLQGESLYERYRALGPLPWPRLVAIARQVCSALAEAHALGIVHRDLKPTNIHLEEVAGDPDFVKVLDFGIAKILHGSALPSGDLTRMGEMVGTYDYMAPEQLVGGKTTGQSDIYTLGLVMYEMLTGERPFGDPTTPAAMLTAALSETPRPVSSLADVPQSLDSIVARCMHHEPGARYRDVLELSEELGRVLADATDTMGTTAPDVPVAPVRDTAIQPAMSDDSLTWIDKAPEPPEPLAASPHTTLPGVVPPARNTPWPFAKPKPKKR